MPATHFPHGVSSYGIPITGEGVGIPNLQGRSIFVDATYGNDYNSGDDPTAALQSINRAIQLAGNGTGDTIFVFPGSYEENVVVDKDYITIVAAMLSRYSFPDIVPASGKALFNQAAQGMVLRNLRLAAPAADTDLMLIEGNGFAVLGCILDGDATQGDAKALVRLKGNAADDAYTASEGLIAGCLLRGSGGIAIVFEAAATPTLVGCTDDVVQDCNFVANDKADIATADNVATTGLYSVKRALIQRNNFQDKNKATYLDFTTSNGGVASDQSGAVNQNVFASDTMTTTKIKAVGTGFTFSGNEDTVGIFDGSGLD